MQLGQDVAQLGAAGLPLVGGLEALAAELPQGRYRLGLEQINRRLRAGESLDAALLIHEGRLVYGERGYKLVLDIGEWWAEHTGGLPLPLGGMVIRRSLGPELIARANRVIHRSVAHGLQHRSEAIEWLLARGTGPLRSYQAIDRYLSLYANEDSLDYGTDGRAAVVELLKQGSEAGLLDSCSPPDWVHQSSNW